MAGIKIYNVIGQDDLLDGVIFARCTTYEKAKKAKKLLEENEFKDKIDIVQDEIPLDIVEINEEIIEL